MTDGPVIPDFGKASSCVAENRLFCPDWVRDNWGSVLQPAVVQHVKLTLIAVAVGFVIAFAAALLAHRHGFVERPFAIFSALVYTIPWLALFQLLVPFTGLSILTVEVALVGYTIAAFVVPEGLGRPIFVALRDYFKTEIIAAGVLAILLAVAADVLLVLAQRALTPWASARRLA